MSADDGSVSDRSASERQGELPLATAGAMLRAAREASGQSRTEIAALTRIPERHLRAIEESRHADLPGRTYALGFSRTYARAVGLDPETVTRALRAEIDSSESSSAAPPAQVFTPGDPARVPSTRAAWIAALVAAAVAVAGLVFWNSYYTPGTTLPSLLPSLSGSASPSAAPSATMSAPIQPPAAGASDTGAAGQPMAGALPSESPSQTVPGGTASLGSAASGPATSGFATPDAAAGTASSAPAQTGGAQPSTHRSRRRPGLRHSAASGDQSADTLGGVLPAGVAPAAAPSSPASAAGNAQ